MERLHPALAHFPIALILSSVLFDALSYGLRRPALQVVGFWNLLLGMIGAALTMWSGYLSERSLAQGSIPANLMGSHRETALFALAIFTLLLAVRLAVRRRSGTITARYAPIYVLAALIGGGFLARTGHTGNRLVFEAAAGVMPPEYPAVAMVPEGGASRQPVWGLGLSEAPAYTRSRRLSPNAARLRASFYLHTLMPGKPLVREHHGCRIIQLPLMHRNKTVAGVMVDMESGRLLARGELRCARNTTMDAHQVALRASQAVRRLRVGPTAWLGGHGAYWNVPILLDGRLIDILRVDMNEGTLIPLAVRPAGMR